MSDACSIGTRCWVYEVLGFKVCAHILLTNDSVCAYVHVVGKKSHDHTGHSATATAIGHWCAVGTGHLLVFASETFSPLTFAGHKDTISCSKVMIRWEYSFTFTLERCGWAGHLKTKHALRLPCLLHDLRYR